MKKIIMTAAMALVFVGCGSQENTKKNEVAAQTPAEAAVTKPEFNLLIARLPEGSTKADMAKAETRAVNVADIEAAKTPEAIQKLFENAKPVKIALNSDDTVNESSTESWYYFPRYYGYNYYRPYYWNYGYNTINYGYNYGYYNACSPSYGYYGYNYYPYSYGYAWY